MMPRGRHPDRGGAGARGVAAARRALRHARADRDPLCARQSRTSPASWSAWPSSGISRRRWRRPRWARCRTRLWRRCTRSTRAASGAPERRRLRMPKAACSASGAGTGCAGSLTTCRPGRPRTPSAPWSADRTDARECGRPTCRGVGSAAPDREAAPVPRSSACVGRRPLRRRLDAALRVAVAGGWPRLAPPRPRRRRRHRLAAGARSRLRCTRVRRRGGSPARPRGRRRSPRARRRSWPAGRVSSTPSNVVDPRGVMRRRPGQLARAA